MIRLLLLGLLANVAALVIALLGATLRLTTIYGERREALRAAGVAPLWAFWHGRQMILLAWDHDPGTAVLVSLSRDGALQDLVLRRLGFVTERGSGGKGGARGLMALARRVRAGAPAAFAVDGGHGPVHAVHEGVVLLAQRTGRPIVPVGASVRRRHLFTRSWDRYLLPLPFARGAVVVGEPLEVAPDANRGAAAAELGRRLHAANFLADAACGAPPEPAASGADPCPVCLAAASERARGGRGRARA